MAQRSVALLAVLLPLSAMGVVHAAPQPAPGPADAVASSESSPLPGQNSISGLEIKKKSGAWIVDFDYFYTGEPAFAVLRLELTPETGAPLDPTSHYETWLAHPARGRHHMSWQIPYPGSRQRTLKVAVTMNSAMLSGTVVASQQVDREIVWPDFGTYLQEVQIAQTSPEENYRRAVALIDSEELPKLDEARHLLETLLAGDPKFADGYVELARIALKTHDEPASLHQAEGLISSALQLSPNSANAKVLLGYVYAHQRQFERAEALFTEVSRSRTDNLWLWSNWGDLLMMEGRPDEAALKYRQGIAHPVTHDTYDRARNYAYMRLIELLAQRNEPDQIEALYKQRVADYGPGSCYSADYTRFLLEVRGDVQGAIDLARRALDQNCDDSVSRELLGAAEYMRWASTQDPARAEALNQARIYLPAGPKALYLLARSDRTVAAARALIASGEAIDEQDNDRLNALAYALQNRDAIAAGHLLALGARPDALVGDDKMPVALLPLITSDAEGVRIMRRNGVDYAALRFHGATALAIAQQIGDKAVLDALGARNSAL